MSVPENYTVINWKDQDNIQRILTSLEVDAANALDVALQYNYVLAFFDENTDFINKAPCFWTEALSALRYSMLMQTARLFDESRDAIGLKKP